MVLGAWSPGRAEPRRAFGRFPRAHGPADFRHHGEVRKRSARGQVDDLPIDPDTQLAPQCDGVDRDVSTVDERVQRAIFLLQDSNGDGSGARAGLERDAVAHALTLAQFRGPHRRGLRKQVDF